MMLSERSSLATQTGFAVFRKLGIIVNKNLEAFPLGLAIVRIAKILPKTLTTRGLVLKEHESFWRNIYERHTFFLCPNDKFTILGVVWPPGVSFPIHSHKIWCAFGVYEGQILETRYELQNKKTSSDLLTIVQQKQLKSGSVSHLPVKGPDIHCMHNPTSKPAVTIHIYGGNSNKIGANVANVYSHHA